MDEISRRAIDYSFSPKNCVYSYILPLDIRKSTNEDPNMREFDEYIFNKSNLLIKKS
jgi:hypothetical protein